MKLAEIKQCYVTQGEYRYALILIPEDNYAIKLRRTQMRALNVENNALQLRMTNRPVIALERTQLPFLDHVKVTHVTYSMPLAQTA